MAERRRYHEEVYRIHFEYLLQYLNIQTLLPILFTRRFIEQADYEYLKRLVNNKGPTAATEQFLEILCRKPSEDDFWLFVECLQNSNQETIAEELRRAFKDLHVPYANNIENLQQQSPGGIHMTTPIQESQSNYRFAYCIRYYQPDIPDSNNKDEENMAKNFVKELKLRYNKDSRKRNLPVMNVYDDWQEVGKNRINLIMDVVSRSNVIILLFTDNFEQVKTNTFASDFSFYSTLGNDIVFPVGLATNRGCIPKQFDMYSSLFFQRDWKVDNEKWAKLLDGIFDKIQTPASMPEENNEQEESLTVSQPVEEVGNESGAIDSSRNESESTDSSYQGFIRAYSSVSSMFTSLANYLND